MLHTHTHTRTPRFETKKKYKSYTASHSHQTRKYIKINERMKGKKVGMFVCFSPQQIHFYIDRHSLYHCMEVILHERLKYPSFYA